MKNFLPYLKTITSALLLMLGLAFTAEAQTQLVFTTQPSSSVAGVAVAPSVTVTAEDATNAVVTGYTGNVTISIATNPSSGTLSGTLTVAAVNGVATFSDLSIDKAGIGYTLSTTDGILTSPSSGSFDITAGAAANITLNAGDGQTAIAGAPVTTAPSVLVTDANGNPVSGVSVTFTASGNGSVTGGPFLTNASGIATVGSWILATTAGSNTLTATAGSLSTSFSATGIAGAASQLVFTAQPGNATAGATISSVSVTAEDVNNNIVTSYNGSVTISINNNPATGTLSGTLAVNAASGVATFSDLSIDNPGTGYTLKATDGTLVTNPLESSAFDIVAGPALSAGTLADFGTQCVNGLYGPNNFTITGTNLTGANILVQSLNGFTFSTTSGGPYSSNLNLTSSVGSYSQTIFVKFSPSASSVFDGNIVISGGGASSINVAATGSGSPLPTLGGVAQSAAVCDGSNATINLTGLLASTQQTISYNINGGSTLTATVTSDGSGNASFTTNLILANNGQTLTVTHIDIVGGTACGSDISSNTTAALSVNAIPTVAAIGGGQAAVCVGSQTAAFSDATGSGTWSIINGTGTATIDNSGIVTGGTAGSVTVVYTVTSNGCTATSTTALTVNDVPVVAAIGGGQAAVCVGSQTAAFTDATGGGSWSIINGTTGTATINSSGIVTGVTAGTVTVVYTVTSSGCTTTSTTSLTINDVPTISNVTGTTTICSGNNTVLTANSSALSPGFNWYSDASGTTLLATGSAFTTPALSANTDYYVSVTDGVTGCSSALTKVTVTINASTAITTGPSTPAAVCANATAPVLSVSASGAGTLTYQWYNNGTTNSNTGGTSVGTANGGQTANYTPDVSAPGTTYYYVIVTGTCGAVTSSQVAVVVNPNSTIALSSGAGTNNQTVCSGVASTNITFTVGGGGTGATVSGLPTGMSGNFSGTTFTISGTPTVVSGTFNYTVTTTGGGCTQATANGTITVNPNSTITLSSGAGTNNKTVCSNAAITNITFTVAGGGTGATVSGLPTGMSGNFSGTTFTISGAPTVTSGTFNYTVTTTGGSCTQATATGTITVNPNSTMSLTSGAGTNSQSVCRSSGLSPNITFAIGGGATGATLSGTLPTGLSGNFSAGVFTISGTVSAAAGTGNYNYTVTTTGGGCTQVAATGTITVNSLGTIVLLSGSTNQTVCQNSSLGSSIRYTIGGSATNATVAGLPTGLSGSLSGSTYTINGTVSSSAIPGVYNYTVTTTGGSCPATATGTITVNPLPTISLNSGAGTNNQTLCSGTTLLTNITFAIGGGGTGAGVSGLPTGLTGNFSAGTYTISGTVGAAVTPGAYNYTVTTSGGSCGNATSTGTITVTAATIVLSSGAGTNSQTVCQGSNLGTNIRFTVGGTATGASVSGLPASLSGAFSGGVFTISGAVAGATAPGAYPYTVTTTGGSCTAVTATGTITVNAVPTIALSSGAGTNSQTACAGTALGTSIKFAIGGSGTGAGVSGLPTGLSGSFSAGTYTISGTISAAVTPGAYNYTVTTTGGSCTAVTSGGTITVTAATIVLSSGAGTNNKTVCSNAAITNITFTVGGTATGATVAGLPAGMSGNFSGTTFTISGAPTVTSGTFNYTVTTTGGSCTAATATGTITVNALATISLTSGAGTNSQAVCSGSPITTNITFAIGGSGTGASVSGLPTGMSGNFSGGTFTISGTPTAASGAFNYTVTTTGGSCTGATATGTITVNALPTIAAIGGGAAAVCVGANTPAFTDATGGGTWSILPGSAPTSQGPLDPNTAVSATSGTGSVAWGSDVVNVENPTGTTAASASTNFNGGSKTQYIQATNYGFNIPLTATITGIKVTINRQANGSNVTDDRVSLIKAGVLQTPDSSSAANWPTNVFQVATYGGANGGQWGGTWTPTDINSTGFGVALSVDNNNSFFTSRNVFVDFMEITVYYTLAPGTATITAGGVVTGTGTGGGVIVVYTVTNGSGCSDTANRLLVVNPQPTVLPITGGAATVCAGSQTVAFADATGGGTWSIQSGTGTATINSSGVVTGQTAGTVTVVYTTAPNASGCTNSATAALTVNPSSTITLTSGTSNQTICSGSAITTTVYTLGGSATGATVTNLPNGLSSVVSGNTVTISGTPTASGTYTITTTGGTCTQPTINGIITLTSATISLSSAAGTNNQSVCAGSVLPTNIRFAVSGSATGATVSGLPANLTGAFSAGTFTISGTVSAATAPGAYNYTVTTTGGSCTAATATGTITVNSPNTISLTSGAGTNSQTVCQNNPLTTSITFAVGGTATGASVTGLPAGLSGAYSGGIFTISGTVSATATTSTYTVTTSGGTCPVTATGTITVNANSTISLFSTAGTDNQSVCPGSALATSIVYQVAGAGTGASVSGLPTGLSGTYSTGTKRITISGTVSAVAAPGAYAYTVTTSGGVCSQATITGTVTVNMPNIVTLTSGAGTNLQAICSGSALPTNVTYTIGGSATGATVTGLPTGLSGGFSGGTFTISGTVSTSATMGAYNYVVTTSGGTCPTTATGTITVNGVPTPIVITPSAPVICNGNFVQLIATGGGGVTAVPLFSDNFEDANTWQGTGELFETRGTWAETGLPSTSSQTQTNWLGNGSSSSSCNIQGNHSLGIGILSGTAQGFNACVFRGNLATPAQGIIAWSSGLDITGYNNITMTFSYQAATPNTTNDYGQVVYSTDSGATWTAIPKKYQSQNTTTTDVVTFPAAFANHRNYFIGFSWHNGNTEASSVSGGFRVDNISVTGTLVTGNNIQWTPATNLAVSVTGDTVTASPTITTEYFATSTVGGCSSTDSVTVTVNPAIPNPGSQTLSVCGNGIINFTPTNVTMPVGTVYSWTQTAYNNGVSGHNPNGGENNQNAITDTLTNSGTNVGSATYTVIPSFNGTCQGQPFTLTVTVYPTIPVLSPQTAPAICNGLPFNFTPTGMPTGVTYTWGLPSITGSISGASTGSNATAINGGTLTNSGTSPGTATYTVTPAFNGGCSGAPFTVAVTVNPTAVASFDYGTTPTYCATGTASVVDFSGTTGGTFSASGSLGINNATGAIDLTTGVGDYTITYTIPASGGCAQFQTTASIHINPAPVFIGFNSSGTIPYCDYQDGSGGFEIITNTDPAHPSQLGVNYQLWFNGSPVSGALLSGTGSSLDFGYFTAGAYTVVGTNTATGCSSTVTATLTLVPVNPPNTYALTVNGSTGVTNATVCAGAQGNNSNNLIIGLNQTDPATPYRLYLNGTAIGSSITGNGGPISFPAVSTAGNYSVHAVTTSCGNLLMNGQVTITVSPLPGSPSLAVTPPSCTVATATITVTPVAGLTYSLNGALPTAATTFTVAAGTTDSVAAFNGSCYGPATTVTIAAQPATPAIPTVSVTQPTCTLPQTGTITVTAPTGLGYSYSIDGTDYSNTNGIFSGLTPGTTYPVTASNGTCTSPIMSVTISPVATRPDAPTALVLTPGSASISGTFTAPVPAPTNYLVIRTISATAPSAPVDGTIYTQGTTALGGFIAAVTTTTSFTDNAVVPGTTYWYWVYAYNAQTCPRYSTGNISGSAVANSCSSTTVLYWAGAGTTVPSANSDITTNLQFNNPINWSILNTSYSVSTTAPTACTDVVMNISTSVDQTISLSTAVVANSLTINLFGTAKNTVDVGPYVLRLLDKNATGALAISAGLSGSSKAYLTTEGGVINLSGASVIGAAAEAGYSYIGNGDGATSGGTITFKGNATFNSHGAISNGAFVSAVFDGIGAQTLTNNSNSADANIGTNAVSFHDIKIGNVNTPAVTLAGASSGIDYVNGGNLTISANSSLTIPSGYGLNQLITSAGTMTLGAGATLHVGGGATSGTNTLAGSNFPGGFSSYAFDCASTTEYYGTTQTVFSGSSYGSLTITTAGVKTAGGNLNICSNVLINSSATFAGGTFSHTVGGNWTNNGAFTPNSSTVAFNGSNSLQQTIGGPVSTTFSGLTINNAAGVTIIDPANPGISKNVNALLTLTSGLLTTDKTDLLILGSAASTNLGAPDVASNYYQNTSYVNGPLQKVGSTGFTFPVGKSGTGYEPITISQASDNSTQTYTAEYIHESAMTLGPIGPSTPQLVHVSGCDYWRLDNGSGYPSTTNNSLAGGNTANLTMYWSPNNALACNSTYVTNVSTLAIGHLDFVSGQSYSGLWTPIGLGGYTRTGTATSGSISYAGVSTFSPFSLATLDGADNPLPIKLDYFTAAKANGYNKLTWKAECTSSSAGFEVERSSDGVSFTGIHYVAVDNVTDCAVPFVYDDYTSTGSKVYYRIKMIDIDGNVTYSEIKLILNDENTIQLMSLKPNPLQSEGWLEISASQSSKIELVILTIDGREMTRKTVQLQPGSNTVNMNTASFAKGMYIVRGIFNNGGQTNVLPFIKQ